MTSKNETETLEFLYSHNTTHFLIDSTDIGKYPAFASIGSNEKGDRYSYIPTLLKDNSQASEKKNDGTWSVTVKFKTKTKNIISTYLQTI